MKKQVNKKVDPKRIPKEKPVTLTDIVRVAQALNMDVQVGLTPNAPPPPLVPPRPLLNWPANMWPGDPTCRSIIADMEYTAKTVERMFRDNPSSRWIITPYEIIPREQFFSPKPAPVLEASSKPQNPQNPQ